MQRDNHRSGGYDWLDAWARMYDAERAQGEEAEARGHVMGSDYWAEQAGRFAAAARRVSQPDSFMRFLLPRLRPTDRLLDIGAGTGRYEPTLAGAVAEVLALEPSPAMRDQLAHRLAEKPQHAKAPTNVQIIAAGWPAADIPPCDVAISAHVIYGVREIAPFLERMDAIARRACFLLLAIRHPASFISPFWEHVHGAPRLPLPGALECLNALYQLGIPAHLTVIPTTSRFGYADEDEALADICWRLRLQPGPETDTMIRAAIQDLLARSENGELVPRNLPQHAAVIWWEHE